MFSNDDALVTALKADEIDAIEEVPPTAIDTLKKAGFTCPDVPGVDQTDFIINSNPKKTNHRELLDPKVREAFDHAIDRDTDRATSSSSARRSRATSIIPPATGDWDNPDVKPMPFDLDKANQHPRRARLQEGLATGSGSPTGTRCRTR